MRQHHRIDRTTLPERPLSWWLGTLIGVGISVYLTLVAWVNLTSIPTGWTP